MADVSQYIRADSSQLNAEDLRSGPITVRVEDVRIKGGEQPVEIKISGGHMPWRPCKTTLRLLVAGWGKESDAWVGKWVQLYRDPRVRYGGSPVGGIRIRALSDLERPLVTYLPIRRGKTEEFRVEPLPPEQSSQKGGPTADLGAVMTEAGIEVAALDAWLVDRGRPKVGELSPVERSRLAIYLTEHPDRVAALAAVGEE